MPVKSLSLVVSRLLPLTQKHNARGSGWPLGQSGECNEHIAHTGYVPTQLISVYVKII